MESHKRITHRKIVIPQLSNFISRRRLYKTLSANKMLGFVAHAGSGKTTLAVDIANQQKVRVCWLGLDPDDTQGDRLVNHLLATFSAQFPNFNAFLPADFSKEPTDNLAELITECCYRMTQDNFLLIFEDFHYLDSNSQLQQFINKLIEFMLWYCKIIIASRTRPPLSMPVFLASHLIFDINFNVAEIQELIAVKYKRELSEDIARAIHQATAGWATGVLLTDLDNPTNNQVEAYFWQFFHGLEQTIQEFLLKTALLKTFDGPMCEAVLGEGDWTTTLKEVTHRNLFVKKTVDNQYCYHRQFAAFLMAMAKERVDYVVILRRQADYYIEGKTWDRAYEVYKLLGNMTAIADLIETARQDLWEIGESKKLLTWIETLPQDILEKTSRILLLKGNILTNLGDAGQGLPLQNQAIDKIRADGDTNFLSRGLVWRGASHCDLGNYELALNDVDEAMEIVKGNEKLKINFAEGCRIKGFIFNFSKKANESLDWFKKSFELYQILELPLFATLVAQDIVMFYISTAQYKKAESYCKIAYDYWLKTNNKYQLSNALNDLGVLHFFQGDYLKSLQFLEQAVIMAQKTGNKRAESAALAGLGDIYASIDAYDSASYAYDAAYEVAHQISNRFLIMYTKAAKLMLLAQEDDLKRLNQELGEFEKLGLKSDYERGLDKMVRGYKALREDDVAQATNHLSEAVALFSDVGQMVEVTKVTFLLGCAEVTGGKPGNPKRYGLEGNKAITPPLMMLLRRNKSYIKGTGAKKWVNTIEMAERLLQTTRKEIRDNETVIKFDIPYLSIQALGEVTVLVNNRLIKGAASPQVQLLLLLLGHANGLTSEKIGFFLYPHDEALSKNRVARLVYEARKIFGKNTIKPLGRRYIFNRGIDYRYDVDVLLHFIKQAKESDSLDAKIEQYKQIVDMYDTPFVGIENDEILRQRKVINEVCCETLKALGQLCVEAGDYRGALDAYQGVHIIQPGLEMAYRERMLLYNNLGEQKLLHEEFKQCKRVLRSQFNIIPSEKTVQLFNTLKQNGEETITHEKNEKLP